MNIQFLNVQIGSSPIHPMDAQNCTIMDTSSCFNILHSMDIHEHTIPESINYSQFCTSRRRPIMKRTEHLELDVHIRSMDVWTLFGPQMDVVCCMGMLTNYKFIFCRITMLTNYVLSFSFPLNFAGYGDSLKNNTYKSQ